MSKLRLPETHDYYALKFDPTKHVIRINAASYCDLNRADTPEDKDDLCYIEVYKRTDSADEEQEVIWNCYQCDDEKLFDKLLIKVAKYIIKIKVIV